MPGNQRCITINAGGTRYTTTLSTLLSEKNSFFTCLLSGDWDDTAQNELFIDRDGDMFKHVLRFLRATPQGKAQLVQSLSASDKIALAEEANFFQLDNLKDLLREPGPAPRLELRVVTFQRGHRPNDLDKQKNANTTALLSKGWDVIAFSFVEGTFILLLASRKL